MSFVEGFELAEKLHESRNSLVFRALRSEDLVPVVLKILKSDYPTPTELTSYRREFEITSSLEAEGVIHAYSIRRHENTLLIVLEDFGGMSIRRLMEDRLLSLDEFYDAAIQIAKAIGRIHAAKLIHKDINPANIVLNPSTGQAKVIDFGICSRFSTENPVLKSPEVLDGTLSYMSPEQTGRMNRALDYRTDFYSLGATFYEMLTGQPPFLAEDDMELVHCHLARPATPPHRLNPDVPLPLSKIIAKLLSKRAEDRYQSAAGLVADLETCRAGGALDRFEPGRADYSERFQIPEQLYGREGEIKTVLEVFDRARRDQVQMLLVSGYSGVGKTALIQEVHKPITGARGYYISGKFEQLKRNVPYSALVSAFRDLVRQLLTESAAGLAAWRRELNEALSPNGQVIIDVIPALELIIGPQPALPEIGTQESVNRFNLAIMRFVRSLCTAEHPLVIFLDDLQWADSATLKLLEVVMSDEMMRHLLLIGAYRDNEVDAVHPLSQTIKTIRERRGQISELKLAPLGLPDVARLVADTLRGDAAQVAPLARLVVQKTQGNPLFVGKFLKTIHDDGLLTLDIPEDGGRPRWLWNLSEIQAAKITDNVVELLLGRMKKLDEGTQNALRGAACIGSRFDIDTLALVQDSTVDQTYKDLEGALKEGLILPLSEFQTTDADDVMSPLVVREFRFEHDRVQQAAYELFGETEPARAHLRIGRRLLETLSPERLSERIFEVVDHLDLGRAYITDEAETLHLARLNLDAGKKASDATAHAAALEYLRAARSLVGETGWEGAYDLTLAIHRELAETEYLNGNFDLCRDLVEVTLQHAKTDLEKADVYGTRIMQHTLLTEFPDALDAGQRALALLGIELPLDDLKQAAQVELGRVAANLEGRDIGLLVESPECTSPEMLLAQRCIKHLTITAFVYNQDLFPVLNAISVNISLEHGNSPESALSYANYGLIIGAFMGKYREGYEFGELALSLCERYHGSAPSAAVGLVVGSELVHWVKHVRNAIPVIDQAYREGLASGDILWAGYLVMYRVVLDTFNGKNLAEILDGMPDQLGFNARTQNQGAADGILAHEIVLSTLAGRTSSSTEFAGSTMNEARFLSGCEEHRSVMAICFYKILKAQALFLLGRPSEALQATRDAEGMLMFIINHPNLADHRLYQSLAMTALYEGESDDGKASLMDELQANLEQLRVWSETCPANYLAKRLLVEAEIARVSGDPDAASAFFDQAIDAASRSRLVQDEALANELAARFEMARRPKSRVGAMYLRDARYAYRIWGANRKLEELETEFPQLLAEERDTRHGARSTGHSGTTTTRKAGHRLDMDTALKAAQAISREVLFGPLLERLIRILIENAGAQRGVLILSRDGELKIEAEGGVGEDDVSVSMSLPIDSADGASRLPLGIVHYVERTKEPVVVEDATVDERFLSDPHVQKFETLSVLCQPVLNQGRLVGIIYLENNLTSAAFTPERSALLTLLAGQIAISIQNAELVENLEEKVRERTAQLEVRNDLLRQTFGRYLSNEVAESLLKTQERLEFGGEKREVTIMMSDLRGFTSISEHRSPEDVVSMLNNFLSEMTLIIQKHNGTIDEFIGDAILVIFGAPFQRKDDATRAVACALEMQLAMERVNAWNSEHGLPQVEMGIGINTGEVVVGNIGSRRRAKYGVVGSNVNLAGRIEGFTVGGQVLVAQSTRDAVDVPLEIAEEFAVEPKGVSTAITLCDVVGIGGEHGLSLRPAKATLVDVRPAAPVAFRLLAGKEVLGERHSGAFVRLSPDEAEIRSAVEVAPHTDLRLILLDGVDRPLEVEVYGKVLSRPADDGCFALRFTSVPGPARAHLDALT